MTLDNIGNVNNILKHWEIRIFLSWAQLRSPSCFEKKKKYDIRTVNVIDMEIFPTFLVDVDIDIDICQIYRYTVIPYSIGVQCKELSSFWEV